MSFYILTKNSKDFKRTIKTLKTYSLWFDYEVLSKNQHVFTIKDPDMDRWGKVKENLKNSDAVING